MTRRLAIRGDVVLSCAWLLAMLPIAAGAMTASGRSCWPCDLLSHFPAQLTVAAIVTSVAFASVGRFRSIVIPAAAVAWNVTALAPFYASVPASLVSTSSDPRIIRVVAMNVAAENHDSRRVIRFIQSTQPDVLVVTEMNGFWLKALDALTLEFPFRRLEPREGHYGIGLLSRLPLTAVDGKPAGLHAIVARVETPPLTIVGTHAFPPFTPGLLVRRNRELADLAAFVREQRDRVVLVGDLNTSSWSPAFQDLLRDARLHDTRLGRGVQPTWPAWLPMAQVPIDHALVSRGVRVHARFVGEHVGSDHLPVVVDISVDEARH